MVPMRRSILGAVLALAACGGPPPPPPVEPTVAQVTFVSAADQNPDPTGRASPTVIFLYALQPGAPFETADPDKLTGGELGDLAPAINRIARLVAVPGKTQKKIFTLPDGATDVGIAVAYRAFDTAVWRAKLPVKPNQVTLVEATIGANEVKLK